jgi:hypothetical protein
MAKPAHPRIFVSYARKDGAELALRPQHDLTAAGFDVWLDTARIHAGDTWTVEIEEAIDRSQVVLALLTPGSYTSEICRAEQLRSLRHAKCVIPLLAAPGTDIPLHLEAKQYRDFTHAPSYDAAFRSLLADIAARNGAALPPPTAPRPPLMSPFRPRSPTTSTAPKPSARSVTRCSRPTAIAPSP